MVGQKYTKQRKPFWRINQAIHARELRVIGPEGKQLGIFTSEEALSKAEELGLDLVEIAPQATPPVVKIIDFAKFRYQEEKREKEARKKEKRGSEQKEVWFTPFMGENDYEVRLLKVKDFLTEGHKVRIVVKFTGSQMAHREFGYQMTTRVTNDTKEMAGIDQIPKFLGKQLIMTLTPVKKKIVNEKN